MIHNLKLIFVNHGPELVLRPQVRSGLDNNRNEWVTSYSTKRLTCILTTRYFFFCLIGRNLFPFLL